MLKISILFATMLVTATSFANAEDVQIEGNVQSKCVIQTERGGIYGNPTSDKLSTARADGGIAPVVRFDVSLAGAYDAKITTPTQFSTSPSLSDTLAWNGSTTVKEFSNAAMADYETNKIVYGATSEYSLHTAGTTWFEVSSEVAYGYGKALPSGNYRALVVAECIAK
jgi:hypothetical protein